MEILAKLQEYKNYLLMAIVFVLAVILIFNFGLILQTIGLFFTLKFVYENLIFVESRNQLMEKVNNIIKQVNG